MGKPKAPIEKPRTYDQLSCHEQTAVDWYLERVGPDEWDACGMGGEAPSSQVQRDSIAANGKMVEYVVGQYNGATYGTRP